MFSRSDSDRTRASARVGRSASTGGDDLAPGYAVAAQLSESIPAGFEGFSSEQLGFISYGPMGVPEQIWGLAQKAPFALDGSLFETPLAEILRHGGSVMIGDLRFLAHEPGADPNGRSLILVFDASEEQAIRLEASRSWLVANTLRRLGKALTSSQTIARVTTTAAQEIAAAADLAAALVWVARPGEPSLHLAASVGLGPGGLKALQTLSPEGDPNCIAEIALEQGSAIYVADIEETPLAASIEGKSAYLRGKGAFVFPLRIMDRLIGALEVVGRREDAFFEGSEDLFQTIAEHLALALSSAALFEQLEGAATLDALTSIPNHRSMQSFLHSRVVESERRSEPLSVVMIDVDHFRSFNEEEGHDAGDEVLKQVATALCESVRPYDMAARYGGEEFALILPGASREDAIAIAERARANVEGLSYVAANGQERPITISAGVAVFPESSNDAETLLKAADDALYESKKAGRNRVTAFHGRYDAQIARVSIDLKEIAARLRKQDRASGEALLAELGPIAQRHAASWKLSNAQTEILKALILVYPAYERALSTRNEEAREILESAPIFRLISPSLLAIQERFDGAGPRGLAGPKIPLLARILQALLALREAGVSGLLRDRNRLDPSIVAELTGEFPKAA